MEILANNEESLIKEIENDINDFYDISSNMVKMHIVFDFKSKELNNFEKIQNYLGVHVVLVYL